MYFQLLGFSVSLFGLYLYQMYKRDPAQMVLYCTSTALCHEHCASICPARGTNVHNMQHTGVSMLTSNRSSKVDITADSSGKEHELTSLMEEELAL